MSNDDIEHLDFEPEGDQPEGTEADPGTVAHMDQEQQAFADNVKAFVNTYGFVHECHCAEDYASGNTRDVPECFLRLAQEAMAACAIYYSENKQLRMYLTQMLQMNEDLATMLKEKGHGEDLEKYFTEEIDEQQAAGGDELQDEIEVVDFEELDESADEDDDDDDENLSIA